MIGRLSSLVEVVENNKECVLLAVKPGVKPLDLIKLGGFEGDEKMFRMSKDLDAVTLTVFREAREPYNLNMGSRGTSDVTPRTLQVREKVCECIGLDFGIVYGGGANLRSQDRERFDELVDMTSGRCTLDSFRSFEIVEDVSGEGVVFVNSQRVGKVAAGRLEEWLQEKNVALITWSEVVGGGYKITKGEAVRDRVEPGPDGVFCRIEWTREDLAEQLTFMGVPVTDENIARAAKVCKKALEHASGMWSWELMNDTLYPEKDMLFEYEDGRGDSLENARAASVDQAEQAKGDVERSPEKEGR